MKLYSLATGGISLLNKNSRAAVDFLSKQEGFVGIHPADMGHTLFLYKTVNNAKIARNRGKEKGIQFGTNITEFEVQKGMNVLTFTGNVF